MINGTCKDTSKEDYIAATIDEMADEEKEKLGSEKLKIAMDALLREFTYTKLTEQQRKMLEKYTKYCMLYSNSLKREFFIKGVLEGMKMEEIHFKNPK